MKKKKRARSSPKSVLLLMLVPMVLFVFYLRQMLEERDAPREPARFFHGATEEVPEPEPEPEPELVERRPLPIAGLVLDFERRPRGGVEVVLADESAVTDTEGRFAFEARVRPFHQPLRVLSKDRQCAVFRFAVTGDWSPRPDLAAGEAATGSALERVPFESEIPRQPQRLRWTIYVRSEAELPANGFGLPPQGEPDPVAIARAKTGEDFRIATDAALWEDWAIGGRVHAQGRTNLPEEASLYVTLRFAGFPAAAGLEASLVGRGRWAGFAVYGVDVRTFSGSYQLGANFNSVNEDPNLFQDWAASHAGIDFFRVSEVVDSVDLFFGEIDEARAEDVEAEQNIARLLGEAHRAHDSLMSRVEEIRALGKGWDPLLLGTRRQAQVGWFHEELVESKDGLLNEAVWREFLDVRWRPGLNALLEEHRARGVGKYREAYDRMDQLLSSILQMSRVYSMFIVYPLFQKPAHPNDFYFDERGQHDLVLIKRVIAEQFEVLEYFSRITRGGLEERARERLSREG